VRKFATTISVLALVLVPASSPAAAAAPGFQPISGAGSTWSGNAFKAWDSNIWGRGIRVNYNPTGASTGRQMFRENTIDFAASDIPYGLKDGASDDTPPDCQTNATTTCRDFAYMPVTAGGTVFMYNLMLGPRRVTNLRLSGPVIAKIFTGQITKWDDPAIAADNPGLTLPSIKVIPVVRSDGSGATSQFTQWMVATQSSIWNAYCQRVGRNPCTQTSAYPILNGSGMVGQPLDNGVAGYVSQPQAVGTIGYVEYSYAVQALFPVAKMLNAAGYYTEPTPGHVAVALLQARINQNSADPRVYLTQDLSQVYIDQDPRTYPLSSYSYMILPTSKFDTTKGYTLGAFGEYILCAGQNQVDELGYSPLPINLVQAGYAQLARIPGAQVPTVNTEIIRGCNNPTFSTDGTNTLAKNDPQPKACDHQGQYQCEDGTGGAKQSTPVKASARLAGPNGGSGANGSGGGGGSGSGQTGTGSDGASAGPEAPVACDPDAGICDPAQVADGAGSGAGANNRPTEVPGVPVAASTHFGNPLNVWYLVGGAALLVFCGLAPPLLGLALANRRARRGDDE
jgi:phosphate ABC transporter phosphate-binding protein